MKEALNFQSEYRFMVFQALRYRKESFYLHTHDELEINIVSSGRGILKTATNTYPLFEGRIVLIGNNTPHMALSDGTLEMSVIIFDEKIISSAHPHFCLSPFFKNKMEPAICDIDKERLDFFSHIVNQMKRETHDPKDICEDVNNALLYLLLSMIAREDSISNPLNEKLVNILRFINLNYTRNISLGEISQIAYMSLSSFCTFFKRETGMTFITYINLLRINKAAFLLCSTDFSINEICEKCGFSSLSNFNHMFKKIKQVNPREYKKQNMQKSEKILQVSKED